MNLIFDKKNDYHRTEEFYLKIEESSFYEANVIVSAEAAKRICQMTLSQSSSSLWREERKHRVTASKAHQIARGITEETRKKYFFNHKRLDGIDAVKYGIKMEPVA